MNDNCRYGDNCEFLHPKGGYTGEFANSAEEQAYIKEYDEECMICLEPVLAKGKQFGVLDSCDHTFCLQCIRGWRATYDKRTVKSHFRTCPICRQSSFMVIPSNYIVNSGPDKDDLVQEYKDTLAEIPCKHFDKGKGQCPFRNSCNYAHILKNGEHYEYPWVDNKLIEGQWMNDFTPTLAQSMGM